MKDQENEQEDNMDNEFPSAGNPRQGKSLAEDGMEETIADQAGGARSLGASDDEQEIAKKGDSADAFAREALDETDEEDGDEEPVPAFQAEPEDDPFASGVFDLEHGTPFEASELRGDALPWRSKLENAKEFFVGEILYRFDILPKEDKDYIIGSYRVELKGFRGGVWTVTIGSELSVVNRREDADVSLSMQQTDFIQLINGDLNPQIAILAEKIKISGDVRKAIAFQKVLVPSHHDQ